MVVKKLSACLVVAVAVQIAVVVGGATPAGACSCKGVNDAEAFDHADAVFVGKVVGHEGPAVSGPPTDAPAVWTFKVQDVFKGKVTRKQQVLSEALGASCGLEIPERGKILVFAYIDDFSDAYATRGQFNANLCGGTRELSAGALESGLATPHPPLRARSK